MRPYLEELSRLMSAGHELSSQCRACPTRLGGYDETPEQMARVLGEFAANGWLNIVGGCCGTTPAHIAAIAAAMRGLAPRRPGNNTGGASATPTPCGTGSASVVATHATRLSGLEPFALRTDSTFAMIGERTNVSGSRKFARLVREGTWAKRPGHRPATGRGRGQHHRRQYGRGPAGRPGR